ncbi:hypothetical protein EV363DRAFT_1356642 [Boletus edulis]|nr:hypothetical protein EV363DRAFT_1356642 [Boletus edulis]
MPAVLPTPTERGFLAAAPSGTFLPPPSSPASPIGSPNGIQLHTIFAIVVGLVGFVILIFAGSFISRLPCFTESKGSSTTSPQPSSRWPYGNIRRALHNHNINGSRSRPRPPIQHVEPMIAMSSQPYDHTTPCPPYEPSPPPYSEPLRQPPQYLHAPPMAVVEV